jgi:hypothetical protein
MWRRCEPRRLPMRTLTVTDSGSQVVDFRLLLVRLRFSSSPRARLSAPDLWGAAAARRRSITRDSMTARTLTDGDRGGSGARNGPLEDARAGRDSGSPEQIRTAVSALRGRRPGPLDDGAVELGGEDSNPQRQGQNLLCCRLHHPRRWTFQSSRAATHDSASPPARGHGSAGRTLDGSLRRSGARPRRGAVRARARGQAGGSRRRAAGRRGGPRRRCRRLAGRPGA